MGWKASLSGLGASYVPGQRVAMQRVAPSKQLPPVMPGLAELLKWRV